MEDIGCRWTVWAGHGNRPSFEFHMDGYTVAAVPAQLWDNSLDQKRLLARVKYLPYRWGWTGYDCDGKLWSDLVVGYEATSIPADLATWRGIYQGPKQYDC